jgi:hypothetical protein
MIKRKQKCKGTIYKINNQSYCVGEHKSKKYNSKNKSKKNSKIKTTKSQLNLNYS